MMITKSLYGALRQLRKDIDNLILWVDALCIYSHRTKMNHLGILKFVSQFSEGFNFMYMANQFSNTFFRYFNYLLFTSPFQFFDLI